MGEDSEEGLGQGRPDFGLTAAHLDVVLAGRVQHVLDLLVVVVVIVNPQETLERFMIEIYRGLWDQVITVYLNITPDGSVEFRALLRLFYDTLSGSELVIENHSQVMVES